MNWAAFALAFVFAVFPLLPAGPGYFGVSATYFVDAAVAVLVVIWMAMRLTAARTSSAQAKSGRAVLYAWLVLVAAISGALVVALALETRAGSAVFAEHAAGLPWRIVQPLDFIDDPFYPARVWLTFLEGFLVFAIVADSCRRAESPRPFARMVSWGVLAGVAIVSVLAIAQYVTQFQLHPLWVSRNPGLIRVHATLDDPNALASYLVLGVGLAIGMALSDRRATSAIAATVIAVVASAAVLTTVSRVALIALPLSALIVLAFATKPSSLPLIARRTARGLLAVGAVVGVALLAARLVVDEQTPTPPTNPIEAVIQTLDPRVPADEVFRARFALWDAALRIARWHPIAGIGLGRYPREAPSFLTEWIPFENTHNFYLQLLAETGLVGLLAFIAMLIVAARALWRAASSGDHAVAGLAWGALIGVLAFAMTLLTGHPLVATSGQVMLACVLALALAGVGSQRESTPAGAASIRTIAWAAMIVVVGVYGVTASRMPSPPWLGDPWGYSWGLFTEERGFFPTSWNLPVPSGDLAPGPPGTRAAVFKWTGPRALLELEVPPGAAGCVLPFAASRTSFVKGEAQSIAFRYGGTHRTFDIATSDLQTLEIPMTADLLDEGRRLLVQIEVSPSFVPSRLGASADQRELGIVLFLPRCQ